MVPGPNAASSISDFVPTTAVSISERMGPMIQTPSVGSVKRSSAKVLGPPSGVATGAAARIKRATFNLQVCSQQCHSFQMEASRLPSLPPCHSNLTEICNAQQGSKTDA